LGCLLTGQAYKVAEYLKIAPSRKWQKGLETPILNNNASHNNEKLAPLSPTQFCKDTSDCFVPEIKQMFCRTSQNSAVYSAALIWVLFAEASAVPL
jgi:hypothetical protein